MFSIPDPGYEVFSIPDPDPVFLPILDPGSRGQKGTVSRIRNTEYKYITFSYLPLEMPQPSFSTMRKSQNPEERTRSSWLLFSTSLARRTTRHNRISI
jgi:hypothetical protein